VCLRSADARPSGRHRLAVMPLLTDLIACLSRVRWRPSVSALTSGHAYQALCPSSFAGAHAVGPEEPFQCRTMFLTETTTGRGADGPKGAQGAQARTRPVRVTDSGGYKLGHNFKPTRADPGHRERDPSQKFCSGRVRPIPATSAEARGKPCSAEVAILGLNVGLELLLPTVARCGLQYFHAAPDVHLRRRESSSWTT
jgi:hypothetical protein